jgi:hypothetical protein
MKHFGSNDHFGSEPTPRRGGCECSTNSDITFQYEID